MAQLKAEKIVWVHGDNLSPNNPALVKHPEAPALFVWDDALLAKTQTSLKRIVFIYESLLELPVYIGRGNPARVIAEFALENNAAAIATSHSVSPGFKHICKDLIAAGLNVKIYPAKPFVNLPEETDLRRFSRYWKIARPLLTKK